MTGRKTTTAASLTLSIVLGLASTAGAEAAKVRWIGLFQVNSGSAKCPAGIAGERWIAGFRPSGLGDNGPTTTISLFRDYGAQNFRTPGRIGSTFKNVDSYSIYDTENAIGTVPMRFSSQVPAKITAKTPFITIKGQIRNYNEYAGCTVGFSMALTRRVEKN